MIELLVALIIGAVLIGIAIPAISPVMNNFQVRSAQNGFVSMVAKARAQAIERGSETRFRVNFSDNTAWIEGDADLYDFQQRNGVNIQSTATTIDMFMTPRGIARGMSSSVTVQFVRGNSQSQVTLLPLGQVVF